MDRQFTSFNELAAAPSFGSTDGTFPNHISDITSDSWDSTTLNMARFTGVAEFKGCPFYACTNEEQRGGILEPPHIHIKLRDGSSIPQKFWLSSFLDHDSQEKIKKGETIEREFNVSFAKGNATPEVQRDIIKHLNKHKDAVMKEWNNYVRDYQGKHVPYSLFPEKPQ